MIEEILKYNDIFVNSGFYKPFAASKFPQKRLAILTSMDTRLIGLLPAALGIHHGDVHLIKNAGGLISDPFDSTIRSLLISILDFDVTEVMVIGHTDCGAATVSSESIIARLIQRGITIETILRLKEEGLNLESWFQGFESTKSSIKNTVSNLKSHPLIPSNVVIQGFVMNISNGRLDLVS